jgi:large subunit ribosomal protein L29
MKTSEIRDMESAELTKTIAELRKELFGLRFSNATGELDDTAGVGRAKRDLARALTVARERELTVVRTGNES